MNNWVEISEEALAWNYGALKRAAGAGVEVLAVVKANGYGHGAERCAVAAVRAGARWLGVTCVSEGVRVRTALREAGVADGVRMLVMCGFSADEVGAMRGDGMMPVVWTVEQVEMLGGSGVACHAEVETGMNRQGARGGAELAELMAAMARCGVACEGVQTHFSSSEEAGWVRTREQRERFGAAVEQMAAGGMKLAWVHAGASSAVDNPEGGEEWLTGLAGRAGARAMVRTGIALYGYTLPLADGRARLRPELRRVMTWKARVLSVRELAAGDAVGYNATFVAEGPMRVALLPVGFADGLRRELSSTNQRAGGWVMVRGERARILGRISMNLTVVDVTGIAGVAAGDEAVVLGEGVDADAHARLAETTVYEILCGVKPCG